VNQGRTLAQQIADYSVKLRYEEISPEAVNRAKEILFDSIGTALGAHGNPLAVKASRYALEQMPGDRATVMGSGMRSQVEGAAFANGTMIKILGMDDSHRSASHIAAQVVPAVLAVGEDEGSSGRDVIKAMVVAYDMAVRLGRTVRNAQRKRGLDVKGTVGSIAAGLAAGLVAGLDVDQLSHAISLAADMSSGTEQYVYDRGDCDTKDLISGFAARDGVFAVNLAKHGLFGPSGALDGEYGFFRAFGDGTFDPQDFADLGTNFEIVSTAFKPHGGCRHTHQTVDAVQDLLKRVQPDPEEIERVVASTYQYALEPSFRVTADPGSRELAGLSIRVATAVALARHSAWPDDYEYWDDPQVRRLRHLIDIQVDPEIQATYPASNGCRVRVELKDGSLYEGYTPYAKGEPELPMTIDEIMRKFEVLTRGVLPDGRSDLIFRRCMNLEEEQDLNSLMALLAAGD
jgi:2-methylcitrate dehydratase PrpD